MTDTTRFEKDNKKLRHGGGMSAASPLHDKDSGSRLHMVTNQIDQAVVPKDPEVPNILSGLDNQLINHTFGVRVPCDCEVVKVIEKYSGGLGERTIKKNPLLTVIYHNLETGEFGCLHIESYQNQLERVHETFGFRYNFTETCKMLHPNMMLRKGTLLSYPDTHIDGHYGTGINANIAYLSTSGSIEDGFDVSEDFLERAAPIATASRVAEWGKKWYPLNLYGDETNFKPFPDIGDTIRPDGLVFALRQFDERFGAFEMSNRDLMIVDEIHDKCIYGKAGATVFDVTVHTTVNEGRRAAKTPVGMETQAKKYAESKSEYYTRILQTAKALRSEYRGDVVFEGPLQNLITQALGDKPNDVIRRLEASSPNGRKNIIQKTYRAAPLDEWRVEVFYEYRFKTGLATKLTNLHGA